MFFVQQHIEFLSHSQDKWKQLQLGCTILWYSKPLTAFAPFLSFLLFSIHLTPAWSINIYPAHFFWSPPRPLSVILSPFSHPGFQLIPLPSGRRWTATERTESRDGEKDDRRGHHKANRDEEGSEQKRHRHEQLSKTDRQAVTVRQGQLHATTPTFSNAYWGGGTMDPALQLN